MTYPGALSAVLKTLEECEDIQELDLSQFLACGYTKDDLAIIIRARIMIIDNPDLTRWDLIAHGISYKKQCNVFEGLENLKALLGYEQYEDCPCLLEEDNRDDLITEMMIASWKTLSRYSYVLCEHDEGTGLFKFKHRNKTHFIQAQFSQGK